ncbi:DUF1661 domain-containing protein [Porphyromonas gulae]
MLRTKTKKFTRHVF